MYGGRPASRPLESESSTNPCSNGGCRRSAHRVLMARIIYALSGQGRGHASRVMAISDALRARGHEIVFCCGGTAREILASKEEPVIPVPPLRQIVEGNEVRVLQTLRRNWSQIVNLDQIVSDLATQFAMYDPDLVVTDFEAFSHRAAARMNLPVISFNHQQIVTETRYSLPPKFRFEAMLTSLAVRLIVPKHPEHVLITSFFFPEVRHPSNTTLVPPIIRPAVQKLIPVQGEHILVYYNSTEGAEHVLQVLRSIDAQFIVYNFTPPESTSRYPNVKFKEPCIEEFLEDLASSRAVLSTAGFTLTSEALYLGKPLLVVPNRGVFEQALNALFLEREGLGAAVLDRALTAEDITSFLARESQFASRLRGRVTCGNDQAVDCIERVIARHTSDRKARGATSLDPLPSMAAPTVGSLE